MLLCLFPNCDAAVTPCEEMHVLGPSGALGGPCPSSPSFPPTSPLYVPESPTNCARQPLLGCPTEQDRPFSLSSWVEGVTEQRVLSEHCQAPEEPACCRHCRAPALHLSGSHFDPERVSESGHVSEMQFGFYSFPRRDFFSSPPLSPPPDPSDK